MITPPTSRQEHTSIGDVFGADIFLTGVQNITINQRGTLRNISVEGYLHRLADFNTLTFCKNHLACVLATIVAVQTRYPVRFLVIAFSELLHSRNEVVPS